jgi:uncharacterized membrane protein
VKEKRRNWVERAFFVRAAVARVVIAFASAGVGVLLTFCLPKPARGVLGAAFGYLDGYIVGLFGALVMHFVISGIYNFVVFIREQKTKGNGTSV